MCLHLFCSQGEVPLHLRSLRVEHFCCISNAQREEKFRMRRLLHGLLVFFADVGTYLSTYVRKYYVRLQARTHARADTRAWEHACMRACVRACGRGCVHT